MRTAQLAQLQLSAMADTKASILMGATFVIFTITIGQARERRGAAAAADPRRRRLLLGDLRGAGGAADDQAASATAGEPNMLFFGSFSQMERGEFIDEVTARLRTEDSIYRTMARDIHQAGMVLQNKKYRMLGYAYRIFLVGLVASCAAFVIQHSSDAS